MIGYRYVPHREHVIIPDDDSILMGYLRITLKPDRAEWIVKNIALYATRELAETEGEVLADDVQLSQLAPCGQMRVIAALNAFAHEQRERIHRLVTAAQGVTA